MKLREFDLDWGTFVAINGKRYYVGNVFDTPYGHDGEYHPVVYGSGSTQLFGRFGPAQGDESRRLKTKVKS
jgi:hypothetical protein